jgi:hypothetical protein
MPEPVGMDSMRQMLRNKQESAPVQRAQQFRCLFVADVCMGFSKAWLPVPQTGFPHPSFFSG